jgi:putative restriction endonuclease
MRYWWVNQNQTYKTEVPGGFLWSPKTKADGSKNPFYENMLRIEPNDVVFSFCDTYIKAAGLATERHPPRNQILETLVNLGQRKVG